MNPHLLRSLSAAIFGSWVLSAAAVSQVLPPSNSAPQSAPAASSEKIPVPKGPLLKSAPPFSQWTIVYSYADEKSRHDQTQEPRESRSTESSRIKKIIAVRNGSLTYEQIFDSAGQKTEKWYSKDQQYTRHHGATDFYSAGNKDFNNIDYEYRSQTGFQGFDWISMDNFVGVQKVFARECLVFRDRKDQLSILDPNAAVYQNELRAEFKGGGSSADVKEIAEDKVGTIACIDLETRLPVALQIAGQTRRFSFQEPPATPITLPLELMTQIEEHQKRWSELTKAAPRPF